MTIRTNQYFTSCPKAIAQGELYGFDALDVTEIQRCVGPLSVLTRPVNSCVNHRSPKKEIARHRGMCSVRKEKHGRKRQGNRKGRGQKESAQARLKKPTTSGRSKPTPRSNTHPAKKPSCS